MISEYRNAIEICNIRDYVFVNIKKIWAANIQ